MFNSGGPSLADIAAVTDGNRSNNGGLGGDNGWWVLIILFALFGGWGNNGNRGNGGGGNGSNGEGVTVVNMPPYGYGSGAYSMYGGVGFGFNEAAMQRGFDNATVIGKLDRLGDAFCALGYDQLAQNNATNNLITQTGWNIERAAQQNAVANMQGQWNLSQQMSDCCCKNENMIQQLKYDMATSDCAIKTLINQVAQQLQWGQQAGFRDMSDLINAKFNELTIQQKDAIIDDLRTKLNGCDRDTALQNLGNYIIDQVAPRSRPAYPGANPNGIGNWAPNVLAGGQMWNNGCCCN